MTRLRRLRRMLVTLWLLLLIDLGYSAANAVVGAGGTPQSSAQPWQPVQLLQPRCLWPSASVELHQTRPLAVQPPFTFPYLQRLLAGVGAGTGSSPAHHSLQLRPDASLAPVQQLRPGALVGGSGDGGVVAGGSHSVGGRFQLLERIHLIRAGTGSGTALMARPAHTVASHEDSYRSEDGDSDDDDDGGLQLTPGLEPAAGHEHGGRGHALATTTTATIPSPASPLSTSKPASAATSGGDRTSRGDSNSSSGGSGSGSSSSGVDHEYELHDRVGRGHFGEVWRARRIDSSNADTGVGAGSSGSDPATYVLKRLFVERGYRTRLSGLREIHFGLKMRATESAGGGAGAGSGDALHVSRLVEWFEEGGALWLVFRDEGLSLTQIMWHTDESGQVAPSERWTRMKMQTASSVHWGRDAKQEQKQTQTQQQPTGADGEAEERERRSYVQAHSTDVAVVAAECAADGDDSSHSSLDNDGHSSGAFGPFLPSPPPSTVSLAPVLRSAHAELPSASLAPATTSAVHTQQLELSAHEYAKDSSALQLAQLVSDRNVGLGGGGGWGWEHMWPSIRRAATSTATLLPSTTGALPSRQPTAALPAAPRSSSVATTPSSISRHRGAQRWPRLALDSPEDADADADAEDATEPHFDGDTGSGEHDRPPAHTVERHFPHDDFKNILYQLLQALAALHEQGITHRDIKPANILSRALPIQPKATATSPNGAGGGSGGWASSAAPSQRLHLRVCDLGSSVDSDQTINDLLYPPPRFAPSALDNTMEYAPPEVLFGGGGSGGSGMAGNADDPDAGASAAPAYSSTHPHSYDMWSAGVVALELLLGDRANVFRIDERVRARVEARVEESMAAEWRRSRRQQSTGPPSPPSSSHSADADWAAAVADRKEKAALFRAFIEYGVYPSAGAAAAAEETATEAETEAGTPPAERQQGHSAPASSSATSDGDGHGGCSDAHFGRLLRQFDPTGVGATDVWLVRLLRRLLRWHPSQRLSASAALSHAYFHGAFRCHRCGAQFEFEGQLHRHAFEEHDGARGGAAHRHMHD